MDRARKFGLFQITPKLNGLKNNLILSVMILWVDQAPLGSFHWNVLSNCTQRIAGDESSEGSTGLDVQYGWHFTHVSGSWEPLQIPLY